MQSNDGTPSQMKMIRLVRLLRFLRLSRVIRAGKMASLVDRFEQEFEGSHWNILIFSFVKILLVLKSVSLTQGSG